MQLGQMLRSQFKVDRDFCANCLVMVYAKHIGRKFFDEGSGDHPSILCARISPNNREALRNIEKSVNPPDH